MSVTITPQGAVFYGALKLGAGFAAYMSGGVIQNPSNLGKLAEYSAYASLMGNGAALLFHRISACWIAYRGISPFDVDRVEPFRKGIEFACRWGVGNLVYLLPSARDAFPLAGENNGKSWLYFGAPFLFLGAYEIATELLAHCYIRCRSERNDQPNAGDIPLSNERAVTEQPSNRAALQLPPKGPVSYGSI